MRIRGIPVHLETMEPGAAYCVKAQAFVKAIGRHSAFSQAECIKVQGKDDLPVPRSPAQVTAPPGGCSAACCISLVLSLLWPHGFRGWMGSCGESVLHSNSSLGKSLPWGWGVVTCAAIWNFLSPERSLGLRPDFARLVYQVNQRRVAREVARGLRVRPMRRQPIACTAALSEEGPMGNPQAPLVGLNFSP